MTSPPNKTPAAFHGYYECVSSAEPNKGLFNIPLSNWSCKVTGHSHEEDQNALTHGWWAHHRPEADSKPAKEQETLSCRGEAQQEGSGEERIYNIHPWKGEERCEVFPVFINASQQSARGNDQLMETALSLQGEGWGRDGE